MNLVLASSSVYRKALLEKLTLHFVCESPEIDESASENESAEQLALRLAEQKAHALASKYPQHLIIGSDQVAAFGGKKLGKPGNHANAIKQLRLFSGQQLTFYTGLAVFNTDTGALKSCVEPYEVKFKQLSTEQIEAYVQKEQPYDCAGSFKSEGLGICLFEQMQGRDPNSLVGLPLIALNQMLNEFGCDPLLN